MAMTSKERMLAALSRQPVDRTPMMILLGETWLIERNNMSFKELRELPDLGTDLIVNTYGEMDCDTVTTGLGCWIGVLEAVGCPCETGKKGAPIEVKPCLRLDHLGEDVAKLDRGKIPDILLKFSDRDHRPDELLIRAQILAQIRQMP